MLRPYIANGHYMANGLGEWPMANGLWRMAIIYCEWAYACGRTLRLLRQYIANELDIANEVVFPCLLRIKGCVATARCESCGYFLAFNFFLSLICNRIRNLSILGNFPKMNYQLILYSSFYNEYKMNVVSSYFHQ